MDPMAGAGVDVASSGTGVDMASSGTGVDMASSGTGVDVAPAGAGVDVGSAPPHAAASSSRGANNAKILNLAAVLYWSQVIIVSP